MFKACRFCLLFTVLLAGCFTDAGMSQDPYIRDTYAMRGIMPFSDQLSSPIDNIEPVSRKLNLSIPLASLPPGPGGSGFDLALNYDSHLYDIMPYRHGAIGEPPPGQLPYRMYSYLNLSSTGGWKYNLRNLVLDLEVKEIEGLDKNPDGTVNCTNDDFRIFRLRVGLPDGSMHILHLDGDYDQRHDGFARIDPAGRRNPVCSGTYPPVTGLLTYYSADGSYLKLEIESDGTDWTDHDWRLFFPDGRRIIGRGYLGREIYDANGNKVRFYYVMDDPQYGDHTVIENDLGEKIILQETIEESGSLSRDKITAPGPNGSVSWYVDWEILTPGHNGQEYVKYYWAYHEPPNEYFPYDTEVPLDNSFKTVRNIQLPLEDNPAALGADPPVHNSYLFGYSDSPDLGSGELDNIRTPLGANYNYGYQYEAAPAELHAEIYVHNNGVVEKGLQYGQEELRWTYASQLDGYFVLSPTTITNPDGGVIRYHYGAVWHNEPYSLPGGDKLIYLIEEANGTVRKRKWAQNKVYCFVDCYSNSYGQNHYILSESVTPGNSAGQTGTRTGVTDYTYSRNGNLLEKREYDWVSYAGSEMETGTTVKRKTTYEYYASPESDAANGYWKVHNPAYWLDNQLPRRLNAVQRVTIFNGPTAINAYTEYTYDDPYTTGKVQYQTKWDSVSSPYVVTANSTAMHRSYDGYGNAVDIYEPEIPSNITYSGGTLVTDVINAPGTGVERRFHYDYWNQGTAVRSRTDIDNGVTVWYGYDNVGRRTSVNENNLRQTVTSYDDQLRKVATTGDLRAFGDGKLQSVMHYDQVGRLVKVQKSDGSPLNDDEAGIKVTTTYVHPVLNERYVITSSPYGELSDPSLEWTCTQYDRSDRVKAIAMFKGSRPLADCETQPNPTGITRIQYDEDWTIVTDPAGKVRKERRDVLGRIVEVVEDPSGLNYMTTYGYDALDNLTQVTQGSQVRTFTYSSLGRLVSASNPESGTTDYTYYDNGNLRRRTDARGVWSESTYDPLHRIATKSYSDSTPPVTYSYHVTGAPNIGQLKSVRSAVAETVYGSYDALGQVTSSTQTIAGYPEPLGLEYDYWLNGALKGMGYPSGRVVNYSVDDAGRANKVYATGRTYADLTAAGITYPFAPDGRIAQMRLGNGLYETRDYRPAGEPTLYRLGTTLGGEDRLKLEYNFNGTANNGNLLSQRMTRNLSYSYEQIFYYDGVNRLSTAIETGGWMQAYDHDRWGNLAVTTTNLAHADSREPASLSDYNSSTNRLNVAGVQYDSAGNQTLYGAYTLGYDAEGRNTTVTSASSGSGSFAYDGDGRRVKKVWTPYGGSTVTSYYVYDALGRLAAEYSDQASVSIGTTWLTSDMLGSVRAITSEAGTVLECYDHLPFGRMLSSGDNGRSAVGCYPLNPDLQIDSRTPQKFTGKERDAETGLDYFGARYFSSPQGRFTTADPYMPSADVKDPQSWNRYVYARNNPLRFIDPNGLDWSDLSGEQRRVFGMYADEYCKQNPEFCEENKGKKLNESIYNTLDESQMATFESVTFALEHTELIDSAGNSMGNALQQVSGVTRIAGETPGSSKGDTQFRLFANLQPGAVDVFGRAQGFEPSSNRVLGLFQVYHHGFPDSFRQIRKQGVTGMEAGLQPSYNRRTLLSDIDIDYRFGAAHLQPANSDVRAPGNYQKFIDRWPGLRNWWDK